jgi:hypothetical protein
MASKVRSCSFLASNICSVASSRFIPLLLYDNLATYRKKVAIRPRDDDHHLLALLSPGTL